VTFRGLAPGAHLFEVRALSPKGDADTTPASYRWQVFEDLVPQQQQQQRPKPPPNSQGKKPNQQQPPTIVG
jgi:hypothetical protein